ncbi:acyltransferase family protein [Rhodoplanes sp. Z2-YC6860]|uniref:acyltransferase family protein n=1 Tax=Rhodoplanes sp. Z2-YC6860 TaxID=674703 RepID=UPI00078BBCF9|nr:acyltransferase family protein [Rhodoplanes sp. Z2-YC6860]AMN45148.1 acyltransferase 3 [Rhodoplanes sp. Z2-YC6860]
MHRLNDNRVDWVDYAKGFCIVMVVMMHSTLGVELAAGREGWMHAVVEFARPFRMPDFFLISGLFLARVIDRDWRDYLDKKVVHFAYFYVLWVTIQFAFKAPMFAAEQGWTGVGLSYLEAFIEPFGTLWFIYLLPIFFVFIKLTRRVPWPAMMLLGAGMEMAHVSTGWTVIDEFAHRFVYIYTGYIFARQVFALAAGVQARPGLAAVGLALWALVNGGLVMAGLADKPGISLGLGVIGAGAVVTVAALMARSDLFQALRYCGRNSIVIYLAFFLPMATTRAVLLKTGIVPDLGTVSLIVTAVGVIGALVWYWAVRGTPLRLLFERPAWARLKPARGPVLQPAE